jgi:peptidyl-prolyl cis-trans isomerase A (cyclophilin A)
MRAPSSNLFRPALMLALLAVSALTGAATAQDKAPPTTAPARPTAPPNQPGLGAKPPAKPADRPADKPADSSDTKKPDAPAATTGAALEFVQMQTSMGTVVIELNREKAPITVENFLNYVDKGFYEGTIFHRIIPTFVIQGGGFTADMKQKPTEKPIKNEYQNGLKNVRGSLSMARTDDPDSATSQFFINVVDNTEGNMNNLDNPIRGGVGYAVFGRVVAGMDVVDKIKDVPTGSVKVDGPGGSTPMSNVPKQPVVIVKMTKITAEDAKKLIK